MAMEMNEPAEDEDGGGLPDLNEAQPDLEEDGRVNVVFGVAGEQQQIHPAKSM
uniref:Uncharacterized protein n=1 Tax=Leersia perrieri TaxID=77586 RepID=A0A0D9WXC1_9ORYZ